MDDSIRIAIEALSTRAAELLEERSLVRGRLLSDAVRDTELDRDIGGCIAGAKALGVDLPLPARPDFSGPPKHAAFQNFINGRNTISNAYATLKGDYGLDEEDDEELESIVGNNKPEMPRIADIIISRLQEAGPDGTKAADIKRFILNTYEAYIHEKTVGMTLYRLQRDSQVHRDGRTWFYGPAPQPEGPTAGDGETI